MRKGCSLLYYCVAIVVSQTLLLLLQSTSAFLAPQPTRGFVVGGRGVVLRGTSISQRQHSLSATEKSTSQSEVEDTIKISNNEATLGSSPSSSTSTTSLPTPPPSLDEIDWQSIGEQFLAEVKEVSSCLSIAAGSVVKSAKSTAAEDIVALCDEIDALEKDESLLVSRELDLRRRAMEFQRYQMLVSLMKDDYDAYTATSSFLSPSRIPREQLPNVQDVAYDEEAEKAAAAAAAAAAAIKSEDGVALVADCELEDMEYKDSPLDKLLLSIFRKLVEQNTGGVASDKPGIEGLLEQGRSFMLQPDQTPEAQHEMVESTLGGLMTPVLPPFYRIFMSGIIPNIGTKWDGKQIGPWFYAPLLTSIVTPTFFAFLVGPSRPNRRKDGQPGGLVVEKCKFLQESGCKGLCLNQCKLPAQQFFQNELGLPLTVSPNFATQECQWSFGEVPLPPSEDPSFPKGCLVGCQSRQAMAATGTYKDLCN